MPLKIYCPNCSEPAEYTLQKPVFCPQCGSKLSSEGRPAIASKQSKIPNPVEEHEDDLVIGFDNIEVEEDEIKITPIEGITIGEAIKQPKTGLARVKSKRINVKKEIESFRKEASGQTVIDIQDNNKE